MDWSGRLVICDAGGGNAKFFRLVKKEKIRVAFISKQQISFRMGLKATPHNKHDKSQNQQSEENIQSTITNQSKGSSKRKIVEKSSLELTGLVTKKSKKKSLVSYPDRTEPGVKKKRALESVLLTFPSSRRFSQRSPTRRPPTTSIMTSSTATQHLRLPTNNIGPPTTYILQTGFFHPAAASAAEDME